MLTHNAIPSSPSVWKPEHVTCALCHKDLTISGTLKPKGEIDSSQGPSIENALLPGVLTGVKSTSTLTITAVPGAEGDVTLLKPYGVLLLSNPFCGRS